MKNEEKPKNHNSIEWLQRQNRNDLIGITPTHSAASLVPFGISIENAIERGTKVNGFSFTG